MTKQNNKKSDNPTIIVCVDTANESELIIRYACYKAKITGFELRVLAVMENSHKNLLFGSKAIEQEKRGNIEKHLKKLVSSINKDSGIIPSISIREGEIVSEITKEIKNTPKCAMIIFGKSNNSMSDNTVLPKISKRVGGRIQVPVLIVPENLSEELLKLMP